MIIATLETELTFDRFTTNPCYEVIDFGYDTETGERVDLPHCDPRAIGGKFSEHLNEWIIPNNWRQYCRGEYNG